MTDSFGRVTSRMHSDQPFGLLVTGQLKVESYLWVHGSPPDGGQPLYSHSPDAFVRLAVATASLACVLVC